MNESYYHCYHDNTLQPSLVLKFEHTLTRPVLVFRSEKDEFCIFHRVEQFCTFGTKKLNMNNIMDKYGWLKLLDALPKIYLTHKLTHWLIGSLTHSLTLTSGCHIKVLRISSFLTLPSPLVPHPSIPLKLLEFDGCLLSV